MIKMKNILTLLLLFSLGFANAQRNIILIIADDLGSDWCGFQENRLDTVNMPNVRKLLGRGVRFSNAWANPFCSPTRAGLLTGRYSFRTGVGTVIGGAGSASLDTAEITIPRLLKNANAPTKYATANIGKWHLQVQNAQALGYPNRMGYDYFAGIFGGTVANYSNWTKTTNGVNANSTNYTTTDLTNEAITWLGQQNNSKPFFLWMAYNAPHDPFHLPPDSLHSYRNLTGTPADISANPKAYFKAMAEAMDNQIGKLYNWLQVNNKLDSTDIIFIGDNGDAPQTAQIPRAKGSIYQAGLRVPFIISGPSVKNQGRVSTALVNTQDLFATIVELAGFANWRSQIPTNKPVDSKSLVPILQNTATVARPWAFSEVFSPNPAANSKEGKTMRNTDYKLMQFDDGTQEFYNLTNDPNEATNLLLRTLNATERTNYNYLCTEMGLLLGKSICNPSVGTNDILAFEKPIIAPNPAKNSISVGFNDALIFNFKINAIDGKLLQQGVSTKDINVSELNNGLYFLEIKRDGRVFTEKIIVEK
jgi:arylsulfatase B